MNFLLQELEQLHLEDTAPVLKKVLQIQEMMEWLIEFTVVV